MKHYLVIDPHKQTRSVLTERELMRLFSLLESFAQADAAFVKPSLIIEEYHDLCSCDPACKHIRAGKLLCCRCTKEVK